MYPLSLISFVILYWQVRAAAQQRWVAVSARTELCNLGDGEFRERV